jgi:hypothetical protein
VGGKRGRVPPPPTKILTRKSGRQRKEKRKGEKRKRGKEKKGKGERSKKKGKRKIHKKNEKEKGKEAPRPVIMQLSHIMARSHAVAYPVARLR